MAVVPMQKIHLFVYKEDKPSVLEFLQSKNVLHISEVKLDESDKIACNSMEIDDYTRSLELDVAQLDFAIKFLSKYELPKKGIQAKIDGDSVFTNEKNINEVSNNYEFKDVVSRCESIEEQLVDLHNEEKSIIIDLDKLRNWKDFNFNLNFNRKTKGFEFVFLSLATKDLESFKNEILNLSELLDIEYENINDLKSYLALVIDLSLMPDLNVIINKYKVEKVELDFVDNTIQEEIVRLEKRLEEIEAREAQLAEASVNLSKELEKLRIIYDYLNWEKTRKQVRKKFVETSSTIIISAWVPKKSLDNIKKALSDISNNFEIQEVEADEGEVAPVLLENSSFIKPFRAVTDVYGLPLYHELDPTPYLSIFFILYFAMCLTDAGYGLIMFIVTWSVLRYLKIPKSTENLVRLLMYGGILTFFIGILFGGWFGMVPEQAPTFMTKVVGDQILFKGQVFNSLGNAMQVLILSLSLGLLQTIVGLWINFIHNFKTQNKKDAVLDNLPWATILTIISLLILAFSGILPQSLINPIKYLLYGNMLFLIFTQGRNKSNIITKLFSGILSLYNLIGYMSDVLSYSRLLALGLATAIIGMAVNRIAGLAYSIPYIGIIFTIIVLIGGHIFNLGINALGSFIHSGRLQFVEFFGKFLEGGGVAFKPLSRESKFVKIKE